MIGVLGFEYRRGMEISLFTTASRTALVPTQPPIQLVPGALSLGVKRPGLEADYSPPSSAEVKECMELYIHSPNMPSWRGAQLKDRDNFTFTFTSHDKFHCAFPLRKADVVRDLRYTIIRGVSKSFRIGRLEQELQMVQLPATRCSCIAIL
jgi:hypothetical protein